MAHKIYFLIALSLYMKYFEYQELAFRHKLDISSLYCTMWGKTYPARLHYEWYLFFEICATIDHATGMCVQTSDCMAFLSQITK